MTQPISHLRNYLYERRFSILLSALLCVFVVNMFFPENIYGGVAQALYLPFLVFACVIVFESKKHLFYLLCIAGGCLLLARAFDLVFSRNFQSMMAVLYTFFFGGVFAEVLRQIYKTQLVSTKIVLAAISGLLLIGYCGFYLFLVIELAHPGSFTNLSPEVGPSNDLFYFSFITILTVGYGYITPHTWIAKNAAVLVALVAYIYSWVVIATIVSEATSRKGSQKSPSTDSSPAFEHPHGNGNAKAADEGDLGQIQEE